VNIRDELSLIIGSDGFLGRNLAAYFDARGYPWIGIGKAAGDLSLPGVADAVMAGLPPVARIFHLVTRQRTGAVQYGIQGELLRINSQIHLNVLEAWRRHQPGAKLISTGSSCTYPESDQPLPESLFGAGGAHPSVYGYAHGKLTLANGCRAYGQQYGLRWLHCVLATLFGPMDNKAADRSHFMGAMIDRACAEKAAGARAFSVWGDPGTVRELLFVEDQIEAILQADRHFDDCIVNAAANIPVRVGDAAQAILRSLDWDVPVTSPAGSFQGAGYKMLDSTRFLAATGWAPRFTLEEGVDRILQLEYPGI
jgi:GDP-L-fucose synthase